MAKIPPEWSAYARLQSKLAKTTSTTVGSALEEALNVIHQPDFSIGALSETDMLRMVANAARQERHRSALLRKAYSGELDEAIAARGIDDRGMSTGASSLDDQLHARRELQRVAERLPDDDWNLLVEVAAGVPYEELAESHSSTSAALRSRVCRLRRGLIARRNSAH